MDYLGHKRAIAERVLAAIGAGQGGTSQLFVLDAFSGTAAVSAALMARGHRVHANDHLELCAAWARAALKLSPSPSFKGLSGAIRLDPQKSYESAIKHLNRLPGTDGFVARNYSPRSFVECGTERRYFTVENARRIDSIRDTIDDWRPHLSEGEYGLLLSTLIDAVMRVSNTAGTYGCYLKSWKPNALDSLDLRTLPLPLVAPCDNIVTCNDALLVAAESDADVLYADPPYTKRQYAAYYHVLETIVRNDQPILTGSTGLREWQLQASNWCYKRRAPLALESLIAKSSANRMVLSYNADGQIEHDTIVEIMSAHGVLSFSEFDLRRYRSSRLPHKGALVVERIYTLERS